jgi:hypothetical protein
MSFCHYELCIAGEVLWNCGVEENARRRRGLNHCPELLAVNSAAN